MSEPKKLQEARVELVARIDPDDIVKGLEDNDEMILAFICQVIALSHSSDLRERLRERLSDQWDDEDYA